MIYTPNLKLAAIQAFSSGSVPAVVTNISTNVNLNPSDVILGLMTIGDQGNCRGHFTESGSTFLPAVHNPNQIVQYNTITDGINTSSVIGLFQTANVEFGYQLWRIRVSTSNTALVNPWNASTGPSLNYLDSVISIINANTNAVITSNFLPELGPLESNSVIQIANTNIGSASDECYALTRSYGFTGTPNYYLSICQLTNGLVAGQQISAPGTNVGDLLIQAIGVTPTNSFNPIDETYNFAPYVTLSGNILSISGWSSTNTTVMLLMLGN